MASGTGPGDDAVSLEAGYEPEEPPRLEPWQRALVRDALVIGFLVLVGWALSPFAQIPHPVHERVSHLEGVFEQTLDGVSPQAAASLADDILLAEHRSGPGDEPEFALVHARPVDRECYGLRWRDGQRLGQLISYEGGDGCEPADSAFAAAPTARPAETATAMWFIPTIILLFSICLGLLVRIVLTVLRRVTSGVW